MNAAADEIPALLPLDRCDTRKVRIGSCELCGRAMEQRGAGKPRRYCVPCEPVGKALAALGPALAARPEALLGVMERIENVEIPRDALTDAELRRLRASAFTIASRGRRLAPGSSGRYTRKTPSSAAPAEAPEAPSLFPVR